MVKGEILQLGRKIIVEELESKYWKVVFEKMKETYKLDLFVIQKYYRWIFGCDC